MKTYAARLGLLIISLLFLSMPLEAKTKASIFQSFGFIESVTVKGHQVIFKGEVSPYSSYKIDNFLVSFAGNQYKIDRFSLSSLSQFQFFLNLSSKEIEVLSNTLITVTPQMKNRSSYPLYYLYHPLYPFPNDEEALAVGPDHFLKTAQMLLTLLVGPGKLKPTDTVLYVGCGLGRVAYPLTYYLTSQARYEGFDINLDLIKKAKEIISPDFQNFNFQHVNIYNSLYNNQGNIFSSNFYFPYEDHTFDFVFLTSVFTHMLPQDVCHYLKEINRVLKPKGTCLITCFLLNQKVRQLIEKTQSDLNFPYPYESCFINNVIFPEAAVAYDQNHFFDLVFSNGFSIKSLHKGCWSGRKKNYLSFQDVIILKKTKENNLKI